MGEDRGEGGFRLSEFERMSVIAAMHFFLRQLPGPVWKLYEKGDDDDDQFLLWVRGALISFRDGKALRIESCIAAARILDFLLDGPPEVLTFLWQTTYWAASEIELRGWLASVKGALDKGATDAWAER